MQRTFQRLIRRFAAGTAIGLVAAALAASPVWAQESDSASDTAKSETEKEKDKTAQSKESTKDASAKKTSEKTGDAKSTSDTSKSSQRASDTGRSSTEADRSARDRSDRTTSDSTGPSLGSAQRRSQEDGERQTDRATRDTAREGRESARDTAQDTRRSAREDREEGREAARDTRQSGRESARDQRRSFRDYSRDTRQADRGYQQEDRDYGRESERGARDEDRGFARDEESRDRGEFRRDMRDFGRETARDAADFGRRTARDALDRADERDYSRDDYRDRRDSRDEYSERRDYRQDAYSRDRDSRISGRADFRSRDTRVSRSRIENFRADSVNVDDLGIALRRSDQGLLVDNIQRNAVLANIGLRRGDRIVEVNGYRVAHDDHFVEYLFDPDYRHEEIEILVVRNGRQVPIYVEPVRIIEELILVQEQPADPWQTFGVVIDNTWDDYVVVDRVLPNTPAFRAGIRAGDTILSFGGRRLASPQQFVSVWNGLESDDVAIQIERDRRRRNLQANIPSDLRVATGRRTAFRQDFDDGFETGVERRQERRIDRRMDRRDGVEWQTVPGQNVIPGQPVFQDEFGQPVQPPAQRDDRPARPGVLPRLFNR